jgi:AbrB family looped-hinge helix DNA binding protein
MFDFCFQIPLLINRGLFGGHDFPCCWSVLLKPLDCHVAVAPRNDGGSPIAPRNDVRSSLRAVGVAVQWPWKNKYAKKIANYTIVAYNLIGKMTKRVNSMQKLATTKLSSRGQVVIPEEIRDQMHLHPGDQFVVFSEKDVVILKMITRPDSSEFNNVIAKAHQAAKKIGLKEIDLDEAIKDARKK